MGIKEYLSQARYLDMRIQSKLEQLESLNELATKCTSVIIFIYSYNKSQTLKNENELLQRKVDVLNYDNQLLHEYRTMFLQFKNALEETANNSTMENIKEIPTIDINALAFADEETVNETMKQYTNNISAYTAYKIYKALKNEVIK